MTVDDFFKPLRAVRMALDDGQFGNELNDKQWVAAELVHMINAAEGLRARLLGIDPPGIPGPPMAVLREVLAEWEQDAADHATDDPQVAHQEPAPGTPAEAWWNEGYRCGILSAASDLHELGVDVYPSSDSDD